MFKPSSVTLTLMLFSAVAAAEVDPPTPVESRVHEVTVYADRARVTREARIELPSGRSRIAFEHLPAFVDAASIRASVSGERVQIVDVHSERKFLAEANSAAVREAQAKLRALEQQQAVFTDELGILRAETSQIEAMRAFARDQLPKDMLVREVGVKSFETTLTFVTDRLRALARLRREIEDKQADLAPALAVARAELADCQQNGKLEEHTVFLDLASPVTSAVKVKLTYMTPGAAWGPEADLRVDQGADFVTLATFAQITQTTGESWDGALIFLSTQRPLATLRLPEVESLRIGGATRAVQASQSSFQEAQGRWQSLNHLYAKGVSNYSNNVAQQVAVQGRSRALFETLQKRGTTQHFAAGVRTVRADGRPVRADVGSLRLPARHQIVAAPRATLNAARTVELTNDGAKPLLPAKVALFVDGDYVGTTEMDFVSKGERFSVFVGIADDIKLDRVVQAKRRNPTLFSRSRLDVSQTVTVRNLSKHPQRVVVTDQIPVSRVGEVAITKVDVRPGVSPNSRGILRWRPSLKSGEARTFKIGYSVEFPDAFASRIQGDGDLVAQIAALTQ